MFKSRALLLLLDSSVNDNDDLDMPKSLAMSILSGKTGAPLLTSISLDTPFTINLSSDQSHPIYEEYLEQFAGIDFEKIRAHEAENDINVDEQTNTESTMGATLIDNSFNYGTINEQPAYDNNMEYSNKRSMQFDQVSIPHTLASYSTDFTSDSRAHLNLLAHYIFHCYKAFKKDYDKFKGSAPGPAKPSKSSKRRNKDAEIELLKAYESMDPEQKIQNSRWFAMDIDHKSVVLYVIYSSKLNEPYYLLFVAQERYPKGLAKLKLQQLERLMKEGGF